MTSQFFLMFELLRNVRGERETQNWN